ncbi:hypothetical protein [Vreelandella subglaciescola]|jgi:hypothetical protein|uniref:Uncharacterized protein n=1 Tax=Vreelandella subglaciescola TaxID=29571 RepID=A0A1M7FKS8_9GAMM|nr:hypothetical protein [Halomonas subglaciescola]SHM04606.1 hypothetical protein SAMN05878437_0945 [Halomonas subglaciescola]
MTRRNTTARLTALEAQSPEKSDPWNIHAGCQSLGLEAPEPYPGETTQEWLPRVPFASLEALVAWGDANGRL